MTKPRIIFQAPEDAYFLEWFKKSVAELERRTVLRRRNLLTASLTLTAGQQPRFKHNLRDPERITAFLAEVRKFHLESEAFFLPTVFNWVYIRIQDQRLRQSLIELRSAYRSALKRGGMRIVHKGKEIEPRELLKLYLNGKYFHNDSDKQALIEELEQPDLFPRVVAMEAARVVARTAIGVSWILRTAEQEDGNKGEQGIEPGEITV